MLFIPNESLHVRGHRVDVWKYIVEHLRETGVPITAHNIADASTNEDFMMEKKNNHIEYSGGTDEGKNSHQIGTRRHVRSILLAKPEEIVRVDGGKDATCASCAFKGVRHCDAPMYDDFLSTTRLVEDAQKRGYPVRVTYERHPLDPENGHMIAKLPASAIQNYVFA